MITNLVIAIKDSINGRPNILNSFAAGFICFGIIILLLK